MNPKKIFLFCLAICSFEQTLSAMEGSIKIKRLEASDCKDSKLLASCIFKQKVWARPRNLVGSPESVAAQFNSGYFQYVPYPEYDLVKTMLSNVSSTIHFVANTSFLNEEIRISFSLSLDYVQNISRINISNLEVFQVTKQGLLKKAFVFRAEGYETNVLASVNTATCLDRGALIYPIYESKMVDGTMKVDGDVNLDAESEYIDLFQLAIAIWRNQ